MTAIRTMPHDLYSEGIVLAAILDGGACVLDTLDDLPAEAFWSRSNRLIYAAACDLRDAAQTVETDSVIARLRDSGTLDEVGGVVYVLQVASGLATIANVNFYAQRLLDKAALRRAIEVGTRAVELAHNCGDADPEEVIAAIERDAMMLRESSARSDTNELEDGCSEVDAAIRIREEGKHGKLALPTGVSAWDDAFYGVMPGRQYLVAGRPGLGKTALGETISYNVASSGTPVLFVSLEMSRERLLSRMAARAARVDYSKWLRGYPTVDESGRMSSEVARLRRMPLHLWAPSSATAQQVRGVVRRAARRGVRLFVLDYFSRLSLGGGQKRNEGFCAAAATITQAIRESGMPGVILCQLNRESEKEKLRLGHLGETSQLEKDADGVMLLDCDNMQSEPRDVSFAVEKNRDGALGLARMLFDGPTLTFRPIPRNACNLSRP